jgi:D-beta-D-heptose 7-phosphate kinase / D-beta-D-heptose 1-phosphate adenosyltransferase
VSAVTADLPVRLAGRALRVVVLGDAIMDRWLSGYSHRLCPEAPVPVVQVTNTGQTPGGAANTAVNLAALGARARLVSAVGDDRAGRELVAGLAAHGVDTAHVVVDPGRETIVKSRVVVNDQIMLRVDAGRGLPLSDEATTRVCAETEAALAGCDAVLVCDYGTGVLGPELVALLRGLRPGLPLLVVDAHSLGRWRALAPDVVTPNAGEAAALLAAAGNAAALTSANGARPDGRGGDDAGDGRVAWLEAQRAALHAVTGADTVAVTLDRDGCVLFTDGQPVHRTWARPAPDNHASGAGDTFAAALTMGLAAGLPTAIAAELAQAAADVVTGRPGTAACGTADLTARLETSSGGTVDAERLLRLVAEHRAAGRRVVFTNGCFDVLHRGHVAYLNQARRLGDVLVVALNSDAGVRRLKGPTRPVNPVADRAAVLSALSCVDHVTVFDEDTPVGLLGRLRPEVYVKGGDYTAQTLPEASTVTGYGGAVHIVDYVDGHSTTALIERMAAAGC